MSWAVEELRKLNEIQPDIVEKALKDAWEKNPDVYKSVVVGAYLDEKISIGKAAELLGMTRVELLREFREKGIPIRGLSKEDVVAEVEALKAWRK